MTEATQDRYATRGELLLVLNCGSSSIKFALFDTGQSPLPRTPVWNGKVQGIGGPTPTYGETGIAPAPLVLDAKQPYVSALERIRERVIARLGPRRLAAVSHRVVHGGSKYFDPIRVDASVVADLRTYVPLAPLHQPFALEAIERLLVTYPALPQFACFDTGFHHTLPVVEQMLPLPHGTWERGLRRYGFHGLSYEYLSVALPERHGELAQGRVIAAHLGSGASLCAMQGLESVATTMGFSALDGLMMGTRPGALDPGAVIYLMEIEKLSLEQEATCCITTLACSASPVCRPIRGCCWKPRRVTMRWARARAPHLRSTCAAACAKSVLWWRCWAGSICWCSPLGSVSTVWRSASGSAKPWAS